MNDILNTNTVIKLLQSREKLKAFKRKRKYNCYSKQDISHNNGFTHDHKNYTEIMNYRTEHLANMNTRKMNTGIKQMNTTRNDISD